MDSDPTIQKMARLLEIGATMLAEPCKNCGTPLFRYHGEMICPACSEISGISSPSASGASSLKNAPVAVSAMKPAVRRQDPASASPSPAEPGPRRSEQKEGSEKKYDEYESVRAHFVPENAQDLRDLLLTKVASLAEDIQDEKDPRRIAEYFDLIEKGLILVEKMNNMS
ncbi:hypothetical protein J5839_03520 [Methanosarcinaceae archaeon]|nr:hypothetical protein [Methanosarcinaceae archaeon]